MIDISIEEAMRCLQLYQEYLPEKGYVFQCFNMAISALKTIEDMQLNGNYTPSPSQNVSRETLSEIAHYECGYTDCFHCKLYGGDNLRCISLRAKELLKKEEIELWIMAHYKNSPKHSDN